MISKKLIVIVGPTAIGKTGLSLELAKHYNTEILSADSRQFYKEMSIGTAAPTPEELAVAPHHFIQHTSIHHPYTVGDFEKEAIPQLAQLFEHHKTLILVGGSGLYINAITHGLDEFPVVTNEIKQQVKKNYETGGILPLQEQLKLVDPDYYQQVDLQNAQRIIRALEVSLSSGLPYSSFRTQKKKSRPFQIIKIGLTADRPILYERINKRVDMMMAQGLLHEAKFLYPHRHLNALNTVGYKEIFRYFDGDWQYDFAIAEIKKNTRRFAKRQMTWFRKDGAINWFDYQTSIKDIITALS